MISVHLLITQRSHSLLGKLASAYKEQPFCRGKINPEFSPREKIHSFVHLFIHSVFIDCMPTVCQYRGEDTNKDHRPSLLRLVLSWRG